MNLSSRAPLRCSSLTTVLGLAVLSLVGCALPNGQMALGVQDRSGITTRDDVAVAFAPFASVATEWKERLDQPYVFLEIVGPYEETGRFMGELRRHVEAQGLRSSGPPFALYFDDPLRVPAASRRSRLAVPVDSGVPVASPLGFAVLPGCRVLYAHVGGRYDQVSGAYPAMFEVMRSRNWVLDGPIREIYQVDPTTVRSNDELVTEIQMPWRPL